MTTFKLSNSQKNILETTARLSPAVLISLALAVILGFLGGKGISALLEMTATLCLGEVFFLAFLLENNESFERTIFTEIACDKKRENLCLLLIATIPAILALLLAG